MSATRMAAALIGVWSMVTSCRVAGSAAKPAAAPRLTAVVPDTIRLGSGDLAVFEIVGTGFDTSRTEPRNTVHIGSLTLNAVPSTEGGTRIRVTLPAELPSGGEAPPAQWRSGRYPVQVVTPAGGGDSLWVYVATPRGVRP